ncbi:MAG: FAD-dependent oxidoreductase [Desulforhopalus sp.]
MIRDSNKLQEEQFDLVIVGGGIHGATLALEAVRAGYTVALCEKGDFGNSTSANSLKIVHGGIRYLQHGDFRRMRESIMSRRAMMTFAPHLVRPLACLMPTYGHGVKGREMMRLAFAIYDLIAFDRNRGLLPENRLPRGGTMSVDGVKSVVAGVEEMGLTGGAVWYDAMADNTERLVIEYVKEAAEYGAVTVNYVEVNAVSTENNKVVAATVTDLQTGNSQRVTCKALVNATGPWLARLAGDRAGISRQRWATAINIVVKKKLFRDYAVGLEGYTDFTDKDALIKRGRRLFFFVPWQERYTMIGTTYAPYHGSVDTFSLTQDDVRQVLAEVNRVYPPGELAPSDVTFFHGGLLPMDEAGDSGADSVQLDKSSQIIDHGADGGAEGFFSIKGVKYTTAPDIAKKMVAILQQPARLGKKEAGRYMRPGPRRAVDLSLVNLSAGQYEEISVHLQRRYGRSWRDVYRFLGQENGRETESFWLSCDPPLLVAELRYFLQEEMASTLGDVVFRRSGLGSAECPEPMLLEKLADFMGRELHWPAEERQRQIESVRDYFSPLTLQGSPRTEIS